MPPIAKNRVAGGMLRSNTPVYYYKRFNLFVKREDLSCPPPGPPFSKARGVYAWVAKQEAKLIGVLDTYHSQAGHAVARACQVLGKQCLNFYPEFKHEPGPREPQHRATSLGAVLYPLKAGRSSVLYHTAKKVTESEGGVMIPNALKLEESVEETAKEVNFDWEGPEKLVLLPSSSGTIAAGVIRGFAAKYGPEACPTFLVHLGYTRSHDEVGRYLASASGLGSRLGDFKWAIIDEGYAYKDKAKPGPVPDWPCNEFYDLKAFRWLLANREKYPGPVLLWNVG